MRLLIAAIAAMLATPATAQSWWEAETNNFIIKSRDSEEETREFAIDLERFDATLRTLQGLQVGEELPSRSRKLTIYRFGDINDIGRLAGFSGVAGFFIPQAGDAVAFTPAEERRDRRIRSVTNPNARAQELTQLRGHAVLQHEYVHYFQLQHFPAVYPRWYVEGFAETLGTARTNDDGSVHIGDVPQHRAQDVMRLPQMRLNEMLDTAHDLSGWDAYRHYSTGWLLTHYLSFDGARALKLRDYLLALGEGADGLTAARNIFGDLGQLGRDMRSYIRSDVPGFDVRIAGYENPRVEIRPMTDAEEAVIDEEMELRRGVEKDEAAKILSALANAEAAHPRDSTVLEVLGRAALAAEDYVKAQQYGERLVEAAPDKAVGMVLLSHAMTEQIEEKPELAEAARDFATGAANLDRADPRPLIAYYYSYYRAGETPPDTAIVALETAYDMAGSDTFYRLLLARQLLTENRIDQTRTVLMPVAFQGHGQGDQPEKEDDDAEPTFPKLMKLVVNRDGPAAIAMIDEMIDDEDDED
jgi:tetratricopeptide (TPR) repeat protein